MRTFVLALLLSIGGCSQYEMMYSGKLAPIESTSANKKEETQSSPKAPTRPPIIRGDCKVNIWISEIHADPKYVPDRQGEYIELYNPNNVPIQLNGWRISDQKRDGHTLHSPEPIQMDAQSYFVLGNNANPDTNGNLQIQYEYRRFNLSNTKDLVRLEDACGNLVQEVKYPEAWGRRKIRTGYAMERVAGKKSSNNQRWKRSRNRLKSGERGTPGTGPWPTFRTSAEQKKEKRP